MLIGLVLTFSGFSRRLFSLFHWFKPWHSQIRTASENEQLIVITRFLHSDTVETRDIAEELKKGMNQAIHDLQLKHIRIEIEDTRLLSDDIANARKIGNRHKASIILWGTDTGRLTTFNVLSLKLPDSSEDKLLSTLADFNADDSTFIIPPSTNNQFTTLHFSENLEFISYLALGHLYDIESNYQEAIQVLAKAIASIDITSPPINGLASTCLRLGWIYHVPLNNTTISMRYYNQALEIDPSFVEGYNNRGVLRLFSNDPTGALADFDQALKLNPKLVGALMSRGTLYNQLGQLHRAVSDYTAFLNIAGDSVFNIAAYFGRGSAKAKLEQFDEAITDFCEALAQEPDDNIKAAIIYSIANTLKKKALKNQHNDTETFVRDLKQALNDYKAAIRLFSSNEDKANAHFEIGSIYYTLNQFKKSIQSLDSAIKLFDDAKQINEVTHFRHQVTERMEQVQRS